MTEKEALLEYINKPILTTKRNRMGCDENWYNSYYAIKKTFSFTLGNNIKTYRVVLVILCNIANNV